MEADEEEVDEEEVDEEEVDEEADEDEVGTPLAESTGPPLGNSSQVNAVH